jgi:glycosyltransferase involved in cell wall biosynthesis
MSKINVLVVPGDRAGSGKFRCTDPHINLQKNFPNDFFVDIDYNIDLNDTNKLKKYDIIFIHRIPQHRNQEAVNIITKIKNAGIKVVIDTDDHWHLDPSHGLYQLAKEQKIPETLVSCLKLADLVTVPTVFLADEVMKFNKNVAILPNAIDPTEPQFQSKPNPSDKIRFGWLGGSSHIKDIELLKGLPSLQSQYENMQIVLCGFDTRGTVRMMDPQTKEIKERAMNPQETTWFNYELFLTDNYKTLMGDAEYVKYLSRFVDDANVNTTNKKYRRIWTKNITQYANNYNNFDIAMAPLAENQFNKYKSQLKIIEAGFHKKPIIAQEYGPYTIDLINAVKPGGEINMEGNAFLVDTKRNHKDWAKHAKKLLDNPELIKHFGERLYETVKDKYNQNNVSVVRAEHYKNLLNK